MCRTIGNQAVQRLVKSGTLQAKLKIGQPGDKYEQEADRVADKVMRMPEPGVQRQEEPEEEEETLQSKPLAGEITQLVQKQVEPEEEEEEMLQAKSREDATSEVSNDLESQINAIKGGGRPLAESERAYFEPRFGADFGQVRLHSDAQAAESARGVNAKAYTLGQDVVFGAGQYAPGTSEGQRLMAHELTHVVQQSSAKTEGNSSSVIRRELAGAPTYITDINVYLSTQVVSWVYSDGTRSAPHLTSTGAGICQNDRSVCYSGNTPGTACTPVGGPFEVTDNRPHRYRYFIDFGRPSIGFHYYSNVDGCPWSHGCVRLRQNAIDLLHSGVVTVRQARTRPGVTATQVWVRPEQPNIVRCWTTASGGSCYIRNATGRGQTRRLCANNDCAHSPETEREASTPEEREAAMRRFAEENNFPLNRVIWTPIGPQLLLGRGTRLYGMPEVPLEP